MCYNTRTFNVRRRTTEVAIFIINNTVGTRASAVVGRTRLDRVLEEFTLARREGEALRSHNTVSIREESLVLSIRSTDLEVVVLVGVVAKQETSGKHPTV